MSARHCVNCGKSFEPVPVNPDEEFCSDWCRKQHDREESTVVIDVGGYLHPGWSMIQNGTDRVELIGWRNGRI